VPLVRTPKEGAIYWDPAHGSAKKEDFEGFDAVIHLAGASVGAGRWTKSRKDQIFLSRCRDTWLLSQLLSRLSRPPKVMFSTSAVGFYGDRGDEELTEESSQGKGFLADLCGKWEKATEAIENRGTRVVHARLGVVLSADGGVLKKMLPLFRFCLGGRLGPGTQWVSWIGIDDVLGALYHCLIREELSGPVNFVAPTPLTQAAWTQAIAGKLGRPAILPLPSWLLKLAFGEMAKETLLASQRALPAKLLKSGYAFRYPDLKTALEFL
jgi:uncharacterized protein (TIGR01777 family)